MLCLSLCFSLCIEDYQMAVVTVNVNAEDTVATVKGLCYYLSVFEYLSERYLEFLQKAEVEEPQTNPQKNGKEKWTV